MEIPKNEIQKTEIKRVVDELQPVICAYGSKRRCDCKFSNGRALERFRESSNGCPELRVISILLENMTHTEFFQILYRKQPFL
jgi:hypothetical protein